MGKILVTGATGTNGKALVNKLRERNSDFVIGSRNPEEAAAKSGTENEIRKFAYEDPSTYKDATRDVDRVFLLGPPMQPDVDKLIAPFIDYLGEKGIKRIVYFSALGADKMGDALAFHDKIEKKLKDEGFDYTILKPTFFAQNFKNYEWENITQRGVVFMPAGEGKTAFIDVNDIAEVAAVALTEDGHGKKTYRLTGGELLSYHDVADELSELLGKKIVYPKPSPEQFREVLANSGAPHFIADYLIGVYGSIADGHAALVTDDVEKVTGRKPAAFKEVLSYDFAFSDQH